MPVEAQRFSFTEIDKSLGAASSLPYLPFTLSHQDTSLSVSGLLDTGATVNVLPCDTGRQLGAVWDQQTTPVHLTGNLARFEAGPPHLDLTLRKAALGDQRSASSCTLLLLLGENQRPNAVG